MKFATLVRVLLAAVVLGGCASVPAFPDGGTDQPPATGSPRATQPLPYTTGSVSDWQAPSSYEFSLDSYCGERSLIGRFRVRVEDGQVRDVDGLDESTTEALEHGYQSDVPTLSELLRQAVDAREEGADVVDVRMAADGSHPTYVEIDWNTDAIDDEACYEITDYTSHG